MFSCENVNRELDSEAVNLINESVFSWLEEINFYLLGGLVCDCQQCRGHQLE